MGHYYKLFIRRSKRYISLLRILEKKELKPLIITEAVYLSLLVFNVALQYMGKTKINLTVIFIYFVGAFFFVPLIHYKSVCMSRLFELRHERILAGIERRRIKFNARLNAENKDD